VEKADVDLSNEQARAKFMCLYAVMLSSFLELEPKNTRAYQIAADHLEHATQWLNENNVRIVLEPDDAAVN